MVRPGRDRLAGEVEVDESYLGGVAPGKHGRGAEKKTPVLIAVEKRGRGMGRVRFARVPDTSADSLLPVIEELIEPGSVVATDGHAATTASLAPGSRTTDTASTRPAIPRTSRCRRQEGAVRSHARRALAVNMTSDEVRHVGLLALTTIGFPHTVAGLGWIDEVIASKG
jgi:transposase-like protein